jgi:inosose dehydratase
MRVSSEGRLVLVQRPSDAWTGRAEAQDRLLACMSAVALRAADHGVVTTFHPNSPAHSLVRTQSDYDRILSKLPDSLGWTPDTGHLAVGGMNAVDMIRRYRRLVNHIHLKDVDEVGRWALNGQGVVDMVGAVDSLAATGYSGWITVEDESLSAESDPNSAAFRTGKWVTETLRPLFEKERHRPGEGAALPDEQG